MNPAVGSAIDTCLARLLTPLVRVLLRYGVSFGSFAEVAKRVYVEMAMKEFAIPGRKATHSRASVITGLSRKEVLRIRRLPSLADDLAQERAMRSYNRAIRVISGWVRDGAYSDGKGNPSDLPFDGGERSFSSLVKRFSGDVPPRPILDELVRVGSVEILEGGKVRLRARAYVPSRSEEEKIAILGNDVADLISTIDYNLRTEGKRSRLQLKVSYDNLPGEPLEPFRRMSAEESRRLLERLDRELSRMDRDANPASEGTGRYRAGVAIYYFEDALPEETPEGSA